MLTLIIKFLNIQLPPNPTITQEMFFHIGLVSIIIFIYWYSFLFNGYTNSR